VLGVVAKKEYYNKENNFSSFLFGVLLTYPYLCIIAC